MLGPPLFLLLRTCYTLFFLWWPHGRSLNFDLHNLTTEFYFSVSNRIPRPHMPSREFKKAFQFWSGQGWCLKVLPRAKLAWIWSVLYSLQLAALSTPQCSSWLHLFSWGPSLMEQSSKSPQPTVWSLDFLGVFYRTWKLLFSLSGFGQSGWVGDDDQTLQILNTRYVQMETVQTMQGWPWLCQVEIWCGGCI